MPTFGIVVGPGFASAGDDLTATRSRNKNAFRRCCLVGTEEFLSPIDPIVNAAFSVFNNKGAYALLVASGLSRAAGIPTGWEVATDLTRKLAIAAGQPPDADGVAWYRTTFGEGPTYSKLLDQLGMTPEERNNILRGYFEPSEDERNNGLKIPTAAHAAIAELVRDGYIRVILTTNFDSLIEMALEAAGVGPTVLASPDAIEGALPLQFEKCTVIKLNGDYRDLRIRNTVEELTDYDPRTSSLLDRVFDEYGLIVCGWSAEWDIALRRALERARSHRFHMYWARRGELTEQTRRLIQLRRGTPVPIADADSFFRSLAEKVNALEQSEQQHPLSVEVAAASVKKYVSEPRRVIALADLVQEETERIYAIVTSDQYPVDIQPTQVENEIAQRVKQFENLSAILIRMLAAGCSWGSSHHERIWSRCVQRLANFPLVTGYTIIPYVSLRLYPGVLALYAAGLAALSAGNFETLRAVLVDAKVSDDGKPERPAVTKQDASSALQTEFAQKALFAGQKLFTPMNDRVRDVLRETLRDAAPDDKQYDELFDRLEYFMSLIRFEEEKQGGESGLPLIGRFSWHDGKRVTFERIVREATNQGTGYPPVQARLFASSDGLITLLKDYQEQFLPRISRRLF